MEFIIFNTNLNFGQNCSLNYNLTGDLVGINLYVNDVLNINTPETKMPYLYIGSSGQLNVNSNTVLINTLDINGNIVGNGIVNINSTMNVQSSPNILTIFSSLNFYSSQLNLYKSVTFHGTVTFDVFSTLNQSSNIIIVDGFLNLYQKTSITGQILGSGVINSYNSLTISSASSIVPTLKIYNNLVLSSTITFAIINFYQSSSLFQNGYTIQINSNMNALNSIIVLNGSFTGTGSINLNNCNLTTYSTSISNTINATNTNLYMISAISLPTLTLSSSNITSYGFLIMNTINTDSSSTITHYGVLKISGNTNLYGTLNTYNNLTGSNGNLYLFGSFYCFTNSMIDIGVFQSYGSVIISSLYSPTFSSGIFIFSCIFNLIF
jgi:hypothetical protein